MEASGLPTDAGRRAAGPDADLGSYASAVIDGRYSPRPSARGADGDPDARRNEDPSPNGDANVDANPQAILNANADANSGTNAESDGYRNPDPGPHGVRDTDAYAHPDWTRT